EGKQTTNLASLNMTKLRGLPIPLPPWNEQIRIVEELEKQLTDLNSLEVEVYASARRAQTLRQAVLNDAFSGKLVRQDLSDEPASILLERIRAERTKPTGNGKKAESGIQAFFGTWPGDETDEELLEALMDIRKPQRRKARKKLAQPVRAGKG